MGKTGAPQIRPRINELERGIVVGDGNDDDGSGQDKEQRKRNGRRERKKKTERKRLRDGKRPLHEPNNWLCIQEKPVLYRLSMVRGTAAIATQNIAKCAGRRKSREYPLALSSL